MEYTVIVRSTLSDLILDVGKRLKEGWVTCGGIAIRHSQNANSDTYYYQALIRP